MPKGKGERTCSVDGCETRHRSSGFCDKHYQRWKKHGDPSTVTKRVYVSPTRRT